MPAKNQNTSKDQTSESLPISSFDAPEDWEHWLEQNHQTAKGIWLRFYKKGSQIKSVNYQEALDGALCYGWIDGQVKSYDDKSYLQKFTPRRPKSIWSKRNIERVTCLEHDGKMKPAGLKQIELAKADGRWAVAYDSPANMTVPDDFIRELSINKEALAFFESLNKANKYAIAWRLQTAKKPETREKRMKAILEMLARGEKFHG